MPSMRERVFSALFDLKLIAGGTVKRRAAVCGGTMDRPGCSCWCAIEAGA